MARIKTVLEFGTYETKLLVYGSSQSQKICLKDYSVTKSPSEYVVSTNFELSVIDEASIKKCIMSLKKDIGISSENIILLLPDHFVLTDILKVPSKISVEDKEKAVKDYMFSKMKLPYDKWFVTHNSIGTVDEQDNILIMAVLKSNLLEIGGIIQKTGLNPIVIDTSFLNLANLIDDYLTSSENKGKNICLVNLGHESTTFGIFKDGFLKVIQNKNIGGYDYTRQIAHEYRIPGKEADNFKQKEVFFLPTYSLEQETQDNYMSIKKVYNNFIREISSFYSYYLIKNNESSIDEIIIAGGGANFNNINVLLEANLKIPIKKISSLYQLEVTNNKKVVNEAVRNSFAAACGCYMRE